MIKLLYPDNGAMISVMTDVQKKFVKMHLENNLGNEPLSFLGGDLSSPKLALFRWISEDEVLPAAIDISDDPGFLSQKHVNIDGPYQSTDGSFFSVVCNFYTGTRYYWRIRCGENVSETRYFDTEKDPVRVMKVENVPNFRDIGGKTAKDGRLVRQGQIYRGTYIEDTYNDGFGLTWRGKKTFTEELGIKTEIDLREEAEGRFRSSPAGDKVRYVFVGFDSAFGGTFNDRGMGQLKRILEVFFDESSYPIYYHCYSGADRTGFMGIVIGGMLGLSDEDIKLDYNFTSLFEHRSWEGCNEIREYFGFLTETYGKRSLSELVCLHLVNYGIDEKKIEAFRKYMLWQKREKS